MFAPVMFYMMGANFVKILKYIKKMKSLVNIVVQPQHQPQLLNGDIIST